MEVQGQREEGVATLVDVSVLNVQGENQEGDGIAGDVSLGEDDIYSGDESVEGVHFDDSEEERDMGDDGFNISDVGAAEAALIEELKK
ncbi:Spt16p [Sesbania bispinosa]|nr:Spt16p [Sesbania bispinosa]